MKFLTPAMALLARLGVARGLALVAVIGALPALLLAFTAYSPSSLALAAGVCAVLVAWLLAAVNATIALEYNRLVSVTERVSAGELMDDRQHATGSDSASRLTGSVMKMSGRLGDIVRQVRSSADVIVFGARDIAAGNTELAQRSQEQAAALEQTASGMEQLAASAQQNASDCARASRLAGEARGVAGDAAGQMRRLAETMTNIDGSARRVADILSTVEGIAFQTNILALNAAVEAARAGDQGRGFAVVASEVRTLAQRSAQAAKEIKTLIAQSVDDVEQGKRLAGAAEATMGNVVGSVQQVSEVIAGIAHASAEQNAGIAAINEAIVEIDSANQQNAAMVEEASAAAASFEHEARQLVEAVSRFKTDRGADRDYVVGLVKDGVAHARKRGAKRACADFNDPHGAFSHGEYYIFALDLHSGRRLAYMPDPREIGKDAMVLQDADGRFYGRDIVETARTHGVGWLDLKILNPKTGRVEPKSVYFERAGDMVLGCGIYKSAELQSSFEPGKPVHPAVVRLHAPRPPMRSVPAVKAAPRRVAGAK
jgi:methyl-accepting chemotaxis protein